MLPTILIYKNERYNKDFHQEANCSSIDVDEDKVDSQDHQFLRKDNLNVTKTMINSTRPRKTKDNNKDMKNSINWNINSGYNSADEANKISKVLHCIFI